MAHGEDVAAGGVAAFHSAPDGAFGDRILFRGVGRGVLAPDASSVAERGERGAGELAAVVHAETPRGAHAVHVGEEPLHELQGVALGPHAVTPLPPRGAVHEHDQVTGTVERLRVWAGEVDMHRAERYRRAGDSTPRHRGPPALRLDAADAWLQFPHQLNTLLFGGFPHQKFIHMAGGSVEQINVNGGSGFSYSERGTTGGDNRQGMGKRGGTYILLHTALSNEVS